VKYCNATQSAAFAKACDNAKKGKEEKTLSRAIEISSAKTADSKEVSVVVIIPRADEVPEVLKFWEKTCRDKATPGSFTSTPFDKLLPGWQRIAFIPAK
jgi:hypothetical protein